MINDKLQKLGFTATTANVYVALLKRGQAKAGELILDTKLPRSAVYASLTDLVRRELISETNVRGVSHFRCNAPDNLVREIEQKKNTAQEISEELKRIQTVPAREASVFEGADGIKRVSEKNLETESGETIYFLGPSKFGDQEDLENFWSQFHKKRIKKGLKSKILYDRTTDESILKDRNNLKDSEAKYLPFGAKMPIWFTMSGDNLSIVVPGEDPLLVFSIKSRSATTGMKEYFEFLWGEKTR